MRYFVPIYFVIGAIGAVATWFFLDHAIEIREGDPRTDAALTRLDNALKGVPGGVLTLLVLVVLFWPVPLVGLLRDKGSQR
jgi:hypothetical protein